MSQKTQRTVRDGANMSKSPRGAQSDKVSSPETHAGFMSSDRIAADSRAALQRHSAAEGKLLCSPSCERTDTNHETVTVQLLPGVHHSNMDVIQYDHKRATLRVKLYSSSATVQPPPGGSVVTVQPRPNLPTSPVLLVLAWRSHALAAPTQSD